MSKIKVTADSGGGSVALKAPASTTSNADVELTLPVADGSADQVLKTDGSAQLSWTTLSAGPSLANDANNRVITGTGSGLNGEANLTFDGTTLNVAGDALVSSTAHDPDNGAFDAANYPLVVQNPEDTNADSTGIGFAVTTATDKIGAAIHHVREGGGSQGNMRFLTSSDGNSITERLRIRSDGTLLLGMQDFSSTPSTSNYGISLNNTNSGCVWVATSTTESTHIIWANGNGTCGTIKTSGTSTSYNTSSDYRLKENIVGITDGITRVKQLAPKRFNFKTNASKVLDGFLAHEVTPIVPEAVSGEKDAVDSDGEIVPQGIDQAKLVPLLTAALQEAIAKIETLETKVAALEAG